MTRAGAVVAGMLALMALPLPAQTVPEGSQASRVPMEYRRPVQLRVDPFRHVLLPHWGLVLSGGVQALNNVFNGDDIRALQFIEDSIGLQPQDVLNMLNLVPSGAGVEIGGQGEAGVYLGGPFGRHLAIGFSGMARAYGFGVVDEETVRLLRDGNAGTTNFSFEGTRAAALQTAELGAHVVLRFGPFGSEDGAFLTFGAGGRMIWPQYYLDAAATANSGFQVGADSTTINVGMQVMRSEDFTAGINSGSGLAGDFLVRLEWPSHGLAFEAMVANVGKVTVQRLLIESWSVDVGSTEITEVLDSLGFSTGTDAFDFVTTAQGQEIEVVLPRIVRFTASAWANRILQIDLSATLPVHGLIESPLGVDVGTTWRFIRVLPLHVGLQFDGRQGVGYTAGIGLEARNLLFRIYGGTLGGFANSAKGGAGRVEFGFFF